MAAWHDLFSCLVKGLIFREVNAAAGLLKQDWGVDADLWGCPSFNELTRNGNDCARWNLLNPVEKPRLSHVETCLNDTRGPVIAATDYVRLYAEQIDPCGPCPRERRAAKGKPVALS